MIEEEKTQELEDIQLCRYLTFNRFEETIDQGLFIPKASLFDDRWEAMVDPMHEFLQARNSALNAVKCGRNEEVPTLDDYSIKGRHRNICEGKKEVYVSCWAQSDYECVAMWKLYGNGEKAVMLETNAKELTDAFETFDCSKEWFACLKKLIYVLPGNWKYDGVFGQEDPLWVNKPKGGFEESPSCSFAYAGLHYKHISYDFEREYRLIAAHKVRGGRTDKGIVLPLQKSFIKKVILQPDSSETFRGRVQDCLEKYNFKDVPVVNSFLDELPHLTDGYE